MQRPTITIAFPLATALALAACGPSAEPTYEADATDEGGGDLIVSDPDPEAVPVDTPDTPMTNVPPESGAEGEEAGAAGGGAEDVEPAEIPAVE